MLRKVICGFQDGSDIAGARAGKAAGLETGGAIVHGFVCTSGKHPEYAQMYGAYEMPPCADLKRAYGLRTDENAKAGDYTLIIGKNLSSYGTQRTIAACSRFGKPFTPFLWKNYSPQQVERLARQLANRIIRDGYQVVNIAGNRDAPEQPIEAFLTKAFLIAKG